MRKRGVTLTLDDSILEAARIALAQGRNLFAEGRGQELKDMLFMKYQDPLAGLMGAHLLLITQAESPTPSHQQLFDTVVQNLRGLVGDAHPDVEALSLKASPAFRTRHRFNDPPIFRRSWQLIVDASRDDPDLLDPDVWERVRATLSVAPYLVWAADDATRRAHQHGLEECVRVAHDVYTQSEEAPLRDPMPAGARTMMTVDEGAPAAAGAAPGSGEPPEALSDTGGLRRIPAFALRRLWKQAGTSRAPQ